MTDESLNRDRSVDIDDLFRPQPPRLSESIGAGQTGTD